MQLAREQFALIEHLLPVQRGNVRIDNLTLLNAILLRRGEPLHLARPTG